MHRWENSVSITRVFSTRDSVTARMISNGPSQSWKCEPTRFLFWLRMARRSGALNIHVCSKLLTKFMAWKSSRRTNSRPWRSANSSKQRHLSSPNPDIVARENSPQRKQRNAHPRLRCGQVDRTSRHIHPHQKLGVRLRLAQPADEHFHRLHRVHV